MDRTVMGRIARARPTGGPASGSGRRRGFAAAGAVVLLTGLGGCEAIWPALTTPADSYQVAGGNFGQPWGGQSPQQILTESATIGRLRGAEDTAGQLLPEAGNVWPGPLPPRTTLANPDAALRGVPDYPVPNPAPTSSMPPSGPPRGLPATSSVAPGVQPSTVPPAATAARPVPIDPLPPRADGRLIQTPNGPVVTTGGTDRVQSAISPGGGASVVTRDGPFTTVTPIGGAPQPGVPQR